MGRPGRLRAAPGAPGRGHVHGLRGSGVPLREPRRPGLGAGDRAAPRRRPRGRRARLLHARRAGDVADRARPLEDPGSLPADHGAPRGLPDRAGAGAAAGGARDRQGVPERVRGDQSPRVPRLPRRRHAHRDGRRHERLRPRHRARRLQPQLSRDRARGGRLRPGGDVPQGDALRHPHEVRRRGAAGGGARLPEGASAPARRASPSRKPPRADRPELRRLPRPAGRGCAGAPLRAPPVRATGRGRPRREWPRGGTGRA